MIPEFITRFDNFQGGLYSAEKQRINQAIEGAVKKLDDKSTSFSDLIDPALFKVEQPTALAYYRSSSITSRYPSIHEKIGQSPAAGRLQLVELINGHLHNTFQNAFPAGLAVLKPAQFAGFHGAFNPSNGAGARICGRLCPDRALMSQRRRP